MKNIVFFVFLLFSAQSTIAAGLINDMQSCQGLLDFIDQKLRSPPPSYKVDDVQKVRTGLEGYNHYIQQEIVSPGLLSFNSGDAAKAKEMQEQVDAYKQTIVEHLQAQYKKQGIYADQAIAVNNCAKKAVPSGQALESLKDALTTMLKLAKLP